MKTKQSNKSLRRDNEKLLAELRQCYAANTCQVINHENLQKMIDEVNTKMITFNELISTNEELRNKHVTLRKRITQLMTQFNISYDNKTKTYKQNI